MNPQSNPSELLHIDRNTKVHCLHGNLRQSIMQLLVEKVCKVDNEKNSEGKKPTPCLVSPLFVSQNLTNQDYKQLPPPNRTDTKVEGFVITANGAEGSTRMGERTKGDIRN